MKGPLPPPSVRNPHSITHTFPREPAPVRTWYFRQHNHLPILSPVQRDGWQMALVPLRDDQVARRHSSVQLSPCACLLFSHLHPLLASSPFLSLLLAFSFPQNSPRHCLASATLALEGFASPELPGWLEPSLQCGQIWPVFLQVLTAALHARPEVKQRTSISGLGRNQERTNREIMLLF